jgi:lantibiotic modifying enzyme
MLDQVEARVQAALAGSSAIRPDALFDAFARFGLERLAGDSRVAYWFRSAACMEALRRDGAGLVARLFSEVMLHERFVFLLQVPSDLPGEVALRLFDETFAVEAIELIRTRYRALPSLLYTAIQDWLDSICELVARLDADTQLLCERFAHGAQIGALHTIELGLADRHAGGRTVAILEFEQGLKLVYKPRSLRSDVLARALLEALLPCDGRLAFRVPEVLDRVAYGWSEFVPSRPVEDAAQAALYYERCGALLFALYACNATDMHHGNLIAEGDMPVLVDLETFLHQDLTETNQERAGQGRLENTVYRTGMLPKWYGTPDGHPVAFGALAQTVAARAKNTPYSGAGDLSPQRYVEQIVSGFTLAYRRALTGSLRVAATILKDPAFASTEVRYVFRGTEAYAKLLRQSLEPAYLFSSLDRRLCLETLANVFLSERHDPPLPSAIFFCERADLEHGDIPRFQTEIASRALRHGGRIIAPEFFGRTVIEAVSERFESLSEADLAFQVSLIQGAFDIQELTEDDFGKLIPPAGERRLAPDDRYLPSPRAEQSDSTSLLERARSAARAVGEYLLSKATVNAVDNLEWIVPKFQRSFDRHVLSVVDHSLFQGRPGIALFFASLAKATGEERFAQAARRVLQPTLRYIERREDDLFLGPMGFGVLTGPLGSLYGIARTGEALEDEALTRFSFQHASSLHLEQFISDDLFDLTSGAAGAVLVLSALSRLPGAPSFQDLIQAGVETLLARRKPIGPHRAWRGPDGRFLSGISHGASGIALALCRSNVPSAMAACREAIAFEASTYCPKAGNWPDRRFDQLRFGLGWGHGAPGIGLARLSMAKAGIDVDEDLDRALRAIDSFRGESFDYIVSGRASHLMFAHDCFRLRRDSASWALRDKVLATLLDRGEVTGCFSVPLGGRGLLVRPGLFNGLAGIALALLHASEPSQDSLSSPWTVE